MIFEGYQERIFVEIQRTKMSFEKLFKLNHRRRDYNVDVSILSIVSLLIITLDVSLAKENNLVNNSNKSSTVYPVYEKVSPIDSLTGAKNHAEEIVQHATPVFIPMTVQLSELNYEGNSSSTVDGPTVEPKSSRKFASRKIFSTGNSLWDGILNQCLINPKLTCIQKNVYTYLYDSVGFSGDVNITNSLLFRKNKVDYRKYTAEANVKRMTDFEEIETEDEDHARHLIDNEVDGDWEADTPIEEVTGAVYDRSVNFMMTHDLEVQLPEMMFDGATLKISPRALTAKGALVHIELEPKKNDVGEGRIFFKKIKKFFRNKLLTAFLALVILIKLIKLKLFFFLPLIVGVATAKKLFLKFLLFLFPALTHIFKLCSWYHQNYHSTKFHHHHHLISHVSPVQHHHPVPATIIHHGGPHGGPPPSPYFPHSNAHAHPPQSWDLSGPGFGPEYLASDIHRNAIATFKPQEADINDINSWGLGAPGPGASSTGSQGGPPAAAATTGPSANDVRFVRAPTGLSSAPGRNPGVQGPPGHGASSPGFVSLQAEKEALLRAAAMRIRQAEAMKAQDALRNKQPEVQISSMSPHDPVASQSERFFSGVVSRVDRILAGMGALDSPCRERAVCQIYKEPILHAPHSNLVSNELSRDTSELPQLAGSKSGMKFYRYVQAARDGQDKKDCLRLHQQCPLDYDAKRKM